MRQLIDSIFRRFGYYRKPAPRQKRICAICQKQIKRRERWHMVDGKPQHWDCQNPQWIPIFKQESEQIKMPLTIPDTTTG